MALLQLSFRGSEGYASPPGDYGIAEYPHTYGVFVSGFTPVGGFIWRDRSTSVDARLAGMLGIGNGPSYGDLIVDFPSAGGNIVIRAAWGDATNEQTHYVEYKDGATTFATINGVTTASGNFLDATNVNRAAADWPSLNATLSRTMVGSKLIIRMGGQGGSNSTSIAHLEVDWTAGAPAPTLTGGIDLADFVLSGSFAVGALSQLSGGFTLNDFALSGVLGLAPGIVTTNPFKNWSGTLLPGVTIPNVVFLKLDRTLPLALTNQITAGDAVMTITNAALVTGTYYVMVSYNADGSAIGAELVLAA